MTQALWPVTAVRYGYVKKVWLTGQPMYNGVTVADSAGAGFCSGYMYYHVDNTTIRVSEGDTIRVGDTLGRIATWSTAGFHHDHFSRNHNSGTIWASYGTFYRNPLTELMPDTDSTVPSFIDAVTGQRFAICANNRSTYQGKDSVYGDVDLICRLDDKVNHRTWKTAVYKIGYAIRDSFGNYVVPLRSAFQFSESIEAYNPGQCRTVYKDDATCNSDCDYDSLARMFYYIFTNSDGDSIIESSDSLECWRTTQVPDGPYWVKVTAADEYGNTRADSMLVRVKNHPPSRRDVGMQAILAPQAQIDSGTIVTPACSTYNFGTTTESYRVRMRIGGSYDCSCQVASHAPGTTRYASFPAWTASQLGTHEVVCSTGLAGDAGPGNDRRIDSVRVVPASGIEAPASVPARFFLAEASPNPFSSRTMIRFGLPRASHVVLSIYSPTGRLVQTLFQGNQQPGSYSLLADFHSLPKGVYLLRLELDANQGLSLSQKLICAPPSARMTR
jgi:hypothetical protein